MSETPIAGGSEAKRIIDDLSLVIPDGSLTIITGPDGGGKSRRNRPTPS